MDISSNSGKHSGNRSRIKLNRLGDLTNWARGSGPDKDDSSSPTNRAPGRDSDNSEAAKDETQHQSQSRDNTTKAKSLPHTPEQLEESLELNALPDVQEQHESHSTIKSPTPTPINNDLSESYEFSPIEDPGSVEVPSQESELDNSFGEPMNLDYNMS
jgi:hypothetical protein